MLDHPANHDWRGRLRVVLSMHMTVSIRASSIGFLHAWPSLRLLASWTCGYGLFATPASAAEAA